MKDLNKQILRRPIGPGSEPMPSSTGEVEEAEGRRNPAGSFAGKAFIVEESRSCQGDEIPLCGTGAVSIP
jgi:hypothetical protein